MSERRLSAAEADLMIGRQWFTDHTTEVTVHDTAIHVPEFDAEERAKAAPEGTEMALFVHGLTVDGTLKLKGAAHSIYVVLGSLEVGRLELGEGTLAVSGAVRAKDYVFAPRSEGVFAVGADATTEDATTPALPPVVAPIVVWHDPRRGIDKVFAPHASRRLAVQAPGDMPAALAERYNADEERFTDMDGVLEALRQGV